MSLDFKALRDKLSRLQGQGNRSSALWKVPAGDSVIRIVPWVGNKNNPFSELLFHYLGDKTYLSPASFGKPDPILEFANKLKSEGDRESWMQAKNFTPKLRTYVPIVVRGEESEGVKFWSFGKTVYTEILSIIEDPDYGDITDPQSGRDITVNYIPRKESDTNFPKTGIRVKPNQSPLAKDAKLLETLLTNQPDLRELFDVLSYDELKEVLSQHLSPTSPTVTEKAPAVMQTVADDEPYPKEWDKKTSKRTVKTDAQPVAAKDVAKEFDELFSK